MCVIIDKPVGATLQEYKLEAAIDINKDGFGLMYFCPKEKIIKVERHLSKYFYEGERLLIEKFNKELKNVHAIFHLRFATHGTVSVPNVHPFKVLNKEEHGRDLFFMHNGMINIESDDLCDKDKSDTALFSEYVLLPTLSKQPDFIFNKAFQGLIESYVGSSRLLFLDDIGRIVRLGAGWTVNEECVVSNNSYFTKKSIIPEYQKPTTYPGYYNSNSVYGDEEGWNNYKPDNHKELNGTKSIRDIMEAVKDKVEFTPASNVSQPVLPVSATNYVGNDDDDTDDEDCIMVHTTLKKVTDLVMEDLFGVHETDIYDLVCDHPEKISDLLQELIDHSGLVNRNYYEGVY